MFDSRTPPPKSSDRLPPGLYEDHNLTSIKDSISSLTYRISELESNLSRKIDRSQCLGIFDKKVNLGHLKHYLDELQGRIREEQKQEEERNNKMQEISIQKINNLAHKIKSINQSALKNDVKLTKNKTTNKDKGRQRIIKPQELFLESNETMFSLIIDEISKIQQKNTEFEKQLEHRNRKIINLNNQVCKKIQKLQNEIQEKLKSKAMHAFNTEPAEAKYFGSSWSQMDRNNKPTIHKGSEMDGSTFQSIRFELITKNIEALQKEMLSKINIKDILPIIKQNTQSFSDSTQELRDYIEESVESMRKILSNQTEINQELSLNNRSGWWHSYTQQNDIAIINKQLLNLVPQIFELASAKAHSNFINIAQQGLYIIKIYPLLHINNFLSDHSNISQHQQDEYEVMIGTEVHILGSQSVLRLEKNSEVRIILRNHAEIVIFIQKL